MPLWLAALSMHLLACAPIASTWPSRQAFASDDQGDAKQHHVLDQELAKRIKGRKPAEACLPRRKCGEQRNRDKKGRRCERAAHHASARRPGRRHQQQRSREFDHTKQPRSTRLAERGIQPGEPWRAVDERPELFRLDRRELQSTDKKKWKDDADEGNSTAQRSIERAAPPGAQGRRQASGPVVDFRCEGTSCFLLPTVAREELTQRTIGGAWRRPGPDIFVWNSAVHAPYGQ